MFALELLGCFLDKNPLIAETSCSLRMTQSQWVSEPRRLVPTGGPGVQQFSRGGGEAHQAVELLCLCCQEVTGAGQGPVQWLNRTLLPRRRGGVAALQSKGVCAPVAPVQLGTAVAAGDAPGTSVTCQLKELLCEAS